VPSYKAQQLHAATSGFAESAEIGRGGFGCVYRGTIGKDVVAIKVSRVAVS
jgi:hypothetical protein